LPAKLPPPTAPTPVAIMWDGVTQNIVRRPKVIRRIARLSVVIVIAVIAIKIRVFRGRWVSSGGWTTLGHRQRSAAQQQSRCQTDPC
jgi:hypothetical protein